MAFYGIQMQRTQSGTIAGSPTPSSTSTQGRLLFDETVISGGTGSPVTYDSNGLFTISSGQNYYVSWFINTRTGLVDPGLEFALFEEHFLNSSSTTALSSKLYPSTTSMKTGQLSGSAIITLPQGQICKFGLYNTGAGEVTLCSYPNTTGVVNANITIHPFVTGSYSSAYGLIGMNLTLDKTDTTSLLEGNGTVKFNVADNNYADNFDYDSTTGEITTKVAGNYLVNWAVNLDGSEEVPYISFGLITGDGTGTGTTLATFESTLLMQHAYSGFAFITTTAGQTFRLVNTCKKYDGVTPARLTYSSLTNKASLRIIGHS